MTTDLMVRNIAGEVTTLWWDSETDVLSLRVTRSLDDSAEAEMVCAEVPNVPHARALEAFTHPYWFAAHSGSITLPSRTSTYATTEQDDAEDSPGSRVEDDSPLMPVSPAAFLNNDNDADGA